MALTIRENYSSKPQGSTFKPVPEGVHLARCYRVIDLGTHTYQGERGPFQMHMIELGFEVHSEDNDGQPLVTAKGEPMTINSMMPATLKPNSKLRDLLVGWRGRDFTDDELKTFEFDGLLGAWAMITVIAEKARKPGPDGTYKTFHNVKMATKVPPQIKNAGLPQGHNKTQIFDIDKPDMSVFESLSDYMRRKIEASEEWKRREYETAENAAGAERHARKGSGIEDMDNDIPF